jgi:signal transduction histidine kinase
MDSFLGVPITVKGDPVGRLYLTDKQGAPEFSARDQALVETFALHAGIAIENARLHEEVQRLILVDERARISRDLHDSVIQGIYGVTLALDDVPDLVEKSPEEARQRVDEAIDSLHAVIRDIRNFIFELSPVLLDTGSLVDGLRAMADELRRHTAIAIEVEAADIPDLPMEVVAELLAIAREALANVARHSGAASAWMRVARSGDELTMEIGDDGRGFPTDGAPSSGHHGLGNMRTRAAHLGGTLRIESAPGEGTRIIVVVSIVGNDDGD